MSKEQLDTRSRFLSLGMLQGLARFCSLKALPNIKKHKMPEWDAFVDITVQRWKDNELSPAIIMDMNYVIHKYDDDILKNIPVNGAEGAWMTVVTDLLGQDPSRELMLFYDTIIMVDTDRARAEKTIKKFGEKILGSHKDPLDWFVKNGGLKVSVASLVTIEGVQSQLLFSHDSVKPYALMSNFEDMINAVQSNSIKMIDNNMEWLSQLSHIDPEKNAEKFAENIASQTRKGFLWFDEIHSQPLMEVMQYFGLGYKSEIQEAIGKAVLRHFTNGN